MKLRGLKGISLSQISTENSTFKCFLRLLAGSETTHALRFFNIDG